MSNAHEESARARKVLALCAAVDGAVRLSGVPAGPKAVAGFLRELTAEQWRTLAWLARVREPSVVTCQAVIAEYERRARVEEALRTSARAVRRSRFRAF